MKTILLYGAETVVRKPPLNYEEISQTSERFIRLEENLGDCYLCELNKALVSPYGIIFKNGRVIKESVYSMFVHNNNAITFYKKLLLGKVRSVSGDCLVVHNAYYDNYYHWTLEALPRLFSVRQLTPQLNLLIHENTPRFVDEYLAFFKFKDIIRIKDNELVYAKKIYLPMHLARGLAHRESVIRDLGAWLCDQVQVPHASENSYPQKVFISREKARYRRAVNEAEIYQIFAGWGYEKISLEEMPLYDQIRLFAKASKVAGIHGAGFSNLLFAKNAALLVDIIHRDHPQDAFYNLACAVGSDYLRVEADGVGKENYCGADDILLNTNLLHNYISSINI